MELTKKIVVAIDGFSSCGKSSFAKKIAAKLNYIFIDTGAMYRAVALYALRNGFVTKEGINEESLVAQLPSIKVRLERSGDVIHTFLNDENVESEIRGVEVSGVVSEISKIKQIRSHLVELQQELGKSKAVVMDGRDIGTVVFPNAELKIYMTASSEVRAQRRFKEFIEQQKEVSFEEIKQNIESRDNADLNRKESPLKKAEDAYLLDNSTMSIEEQMEWFYAQLKDKKYLVE